MIKAFKTISFLEGVSYLALFFIAMPLKYGMGNEILMQPVGMGHGFLFIAYVIMAILIKGQMK